jgi:hypothetical protein
MKTIMTKVNALREKSSSGIRLASVSKSDEKMADSLKVEQYVSVIRASSIDPT